ncbi:GGDEF domain-containing protein [Candidatus Wolfebacteria bacterium]|nr:GGDEF domain-containing protein [Candidatus Wolfebacteria bacterium]
MSETAKQLKKEIRRLIGLIEKKNKEIIRLQMAADHDFLTGLYNRQGFVREAWKFLNEAGHTVHTKKEKRRFRIKDFSLIFIDIDDLKKVNDVYGHKSGDKLLKSAAEIFSNSIREFDVVARWGGDEFVIGLLDASENEAYKIATKIKNRLNKLRIPEVKEKRKFTASFGVISAVSKRRKEEIFNLYELIEKADIAMYQAKKNMGKNFIMVL